LRGQEAFYGRQVITATREMVEMGSDEILREADKVDVAFLVVGDPLGYVPFFLRPHFMSFLLPMRVSGLIRCV